MRLSDLPAWNEICEIQRRYVEAYKARQPGACQVMGNFTTYPGKCGHLQQLVEEHKPKIALEVGFNCGHTAAIILGSSHDVKLYTFDIFDRPYMADAIEVIQKYHDVVWTPGRSQDTLPEFFKVVDLKIDLALIDGEHSYDGVVSDISNVASRINVGGLLIIDDVEIPEISDAVRDSIPPHFHVHSTFETERITRDRTSKVVTFRRIA